MSALNMIVLILSLIVTAGMICRLDMLHFRTHKLGVILFYVGSLGAIVNVVSHAWTDRLDLQDYCILVSLIAALSVSVRTWKDKAPSYIEKGQP